MQARSCRFLFLGLTAELHARKKRARPRKIQIKDALTTRIYFHGSLKFTMQSVEDSGENKLVASGTSTETAETTKKKRPRSRDITQLKAEAENMKLSLSSLASEREKSQAKERTAFFDNLFELVQTTNVRMDRKVLEHIGELLRLNVHPDNIVEFLSTVRAKEEEEREVIFI